MIKLVDNSKKIRTLVKKCLGIHRGVQSKFDKLIEREAKRLVAQHLADLESAGIIYKIKENE